MPPRSSNMSTETLTWVGIHLGPQVGSNDAVIGVRVVLDRVDGNVVYGRALKIGEQDLGQGVAVNAGQRLVFESVRVTLNDVERYAQAYPDGYTPIANTVWTWVHIPPSQGDTFFNYLFAAARRLDQAHALWIHALEGLNVGPEEPFIHARARVFEALSTTESMCNALSRAIAMISDAPSKLGVGTLAPNGLTNIQGALTAIRNAFEHIDERAIGKARREGQAEALSIFDQRDLVTKGVVTYAGYTLNLKTEILPALLAGRDFICDVLTEAGTAKTMNTPIIYEGVEDENSGKVVLVPAVL